MKSVGLVGWRGMVGSVLVARMREEGDFALIEPALFLDYPGGQAGAGRRARRRHAGGRQ